MSKLITNTVRHVDGSNDNITLDSSQNVTVEGNLTVDGTSTLTGQLKANALRHTGASSDAVTLASDGTCTAKITNNLSNRNIIINGAMAIDQRKNGASSDTTGDVYLSCDRFKSLYAAASKFTIQQVASTLSGFEKALKITSAAATTASSSQHYLMEYNFEGHDVARLALGTSDAKTFTLSFYVKSSLTGNFSVSFNNGADNRCYATTYNIASAATWERKTITVAGDTTGTWTTDNTEGLAIKWDLGSGSNFDVTANTWSAVDKFKVAGSVALVATSGATLEITGVQLEVGDVATDFEHRSYGDELLRCERYYQVKTGYCGHVVSSSAIYIVGPLNPTMRATPTVGATAAIIINDASVNDTQSSINVGQTDITNRGWFCECGNFDSLTSNRPALQRPNGGSFTFAAEL